MNNRGALFANFRRRGFAYVGMVALLNCIGFAYYLYYLFKNGYLPSPFLYDKSDTLMDLFNVLCWAYDEGRYTEWNSVYPPLNFVVFRVLNFLVAGISSGGAELMRDNSQLLIALFVLIYISVPVVVINTKPWQSIEKIEKLLIYLAIACSSPMLFVLERGNLLLLAPVLVALVLSKTGWLRRFLIALLINIKPYFAILLIYYVVRRNRNGFLACSFVAGLLFIVPGLWLDDSFYRFFFNILSFSKEEDVFSLREVMSLPSSMSALSYVLNSSRGVNFVECCMIPEMTAFFAVLIEALKLFVLSVSLLILFVKSRLMRDAEIFALLIVFVSNLGVSVGGYTFILYAALIPVVMRLRFRVVCIALISLISLPLDIVPLFGGGVGEQYSYLAGANVNVFWTLGLGGVLRPMANIILLFLLSIEFFMRASGCQRRDFFESNRNS